MSQVRKSKLANNEIYHVINRGVSDLPIFLDVDDYYRCIFSLYGFNDDRPVEIRRERDQKKNFGGRLTSANFFIHLEGGFFYANLRSRRNFLYFLV